MLFVSVLKRKIKSTHKKALRLLRIIYEVDICAETFCFALAGNFQKISSR